MPGETPIRPDRRFVPRKWILLWLLVAPCVLFAASVMVVQASAPAQETPPDLLPQPVQITVQQQLPMSITLTLPETMSFVAPSVASSVAPVACGDRHADGDPVGGHLSNRAADRDAADHARRQLSVLRDGTDHAGAARRRHR